jgi:hypothetical protein
MPVRSSGYFNNPAFAQAASNLSSLFAPPSGSDAAGWASANAKREEASRLAQLFAAGASPSEQAALTGVQGYGQTPQGFTYQVDQGNTTTRRGQDIGAQTSIANNAADNAAAADRLGVTDATARYGIDTQAATSRTNSIGDNNTKMLGNIYQPLNVGQVAPAIDSTIAAAFGYDIPSVPQRAGLAPTPSETEVKGAILQGLPAMDQRNAALSGINVENVVGPNNVPEVVARPDAIGRQPYFNKGAEAKPQNAVALMPDGKTRVPAVQGPDGVWVHAQTGQQLPANIQIFDLPKATGSAADVGLAPTVSNTTQANNQEAEVSRALNVLDLYESSVRGNPGSIGLAGLIRGTAQNAAQTVQDLAKTFGKDAPQIQDVANEVRQGLSKIAPESFDRSIPEQEFLQSTLAYALARTENPSGEVSRQAYNAALERVKGGGLLANQQSALASIDTNRKVLQSQLEGIRTLRAPGTGRTDTSFQGPGAVEKWVRGADGKLMKAN